MEFYGLFFFYISNVWLQLICYRFEEIFLIYFFSKDKYKQVGVRVKNLYW